MTQTFFTSDHHFGHKNIIDYESREFSSIEDMDKYMIKQWNEAVRGDDIVYHAGDFSFYNKERTQYIFKQLNGRKRLVMGNHDRARTKTWWKDIGFEEIYDHPICLKEFYWLSHEPMYLNKHMPYINLHGHTHSTKLVENNYINLCVEHWEYTPVMFEVIEKVVRDMNK